MLGPGIHGPPGRGTGRSELIRDLKNVGPGPVRDFQIRIGPCPVRSEDLFFCWSWPDPRSQMSVRDRPVLVRGSLA